MPRLISPANPANYAVGNTDGFTIFGQASTSVNTGSGSYVIPFNSHQTGNLVTVDSTNHRFTIQIPGIYMVGQHHLAEVATQIYIRRNGTAIGGSFTQGASGSNDNMAAQAFSTMAQGDYFDFFNSSGAVHQNTSFNLMWCIMISPQI